MHGNSMADGQSKQKETKKSQTYKPSLRFIPRKEVLFITSLSNSVMYSLIAKGLFPKPLHPHNSRSSFWLESEVHAWMRERLKEAGMEVEA